KGLCRSAIDMRRTHPSKDGGTASEKETGYRDRYSYSREGPAGESPGTLLDTDKTGNTEKDG
ncbi:MAG: hypothetical protein MIO92_03870, partial [Methanosarcinaceae archaeon]|nr:hypothetical protein [Methanosarcinaceae archaeon]